MARKYKGGDPAAARFQARQRSAKPAAKAEPEEPKNEEGEPSAAPAAEDSSAKSD